MSSVFAEFQQHTNETFLLMANKLKNSFFAFDSVTIIDFYFPSIESPAEIIYSAHQCLTGRVEPSSRKILVEATNCNEEHLIICRKVAKLVPDCPASKIVRMQAVLEVFLSPDLKLPLLRAAALKKAKYQEMISRLDLGRSYDGLLSSLWYSTLPCFGIQNFTTGNPILNYCEWKGVPISCSAIFTVFPTGLFNSMIF